MASESYVPGSRIVAGNNTHHAQLTGGSLLSIACGHVGLVSAELQELYASTAQRTLPAGTRFFCGSRMCTCDYRIIARHVDSPLYYADKKVYRALLDDVGVGA